MSSPPAFRLGVNYWPADHAMGWWKKWSRAALDADFAQMKGAGLDSVRVFLTWEDFQPEPDVIAPKMLEHLEGTLNAASAAGLEVMPTLFTGHMSGANFFPPWAVQRASSPGRFPVVCGGQVTLARPLNWYTDEAVKAAQVRLATACAARLAGHPALLAWDLGNENSNCTIPDTRDSAVSWLHAVTGALRDEDPRTPITIGIHMEDLEEDRRLGPSEAASACDFLTMHGYPGYASFTRGPTDERLLPFLAQLTRFLGGGKEVLFSEFGVPTLSVASRTQPGNSGPALVSEEEAAGYVERGLRALGESGASGAMLWCHADYSPHLFNTAPFDVAPHERTFGMFRPDGSPKPVVDAVRTFAHQHRTLAAAPRVPESSFIDLSPDDYYDAPRRHLERLFHKFCGVLGEAEPYSA